MMLRIRIGFKNGVELPITCDEFKCTKSELDGEIIAYNIKGIKDNKPLFLRLEDVEYIYREMNNNEIN